MSQVKTNEPNFQRGDVVAVKSQSRFNGWIGTVSDPDRKAQIGGRMIAVDFNNGVYGKFTGVVFYPGELVHN